MASEDMDPRIAEAVARVPPEYRDQAEADVAALLSSGVATVGQLSHACVDASLPVELRATACWLLGRLGAGGFDDLVAALADAEPSVRAEAARAIGALEDAGAVAVLERVLVGDSESTVRSMAAAQLGYLGGDVASAALAAVLRDSSEDPQLRSTCAEALGDTFDRSAVPLLLESLDDPADVVRLDAVLALTQLGDLRALPRMRELAARDVASVREAAVEGVAALEASLPGIRAGEDYAAFACRTLDDDLLEHVSYLCELAAELGEHERMPVQRLDVYPARWAADADGHHRVTGPHPDADVSAWARANRRMAARVLASWREELERRMPRRRPRVAWRRVRGIEDWADAEALELMVLFDDDAIGDFDLGLPADPEPLDEDERRSLCSPA